MNWTALAFLIGPLAVVYVLNRIVCNASAKRRQMGEENGDL